MKNLPTLVRDAFKTAQASGDIVYYPTQVAILHCNSFPFQLRYSPALAHKPKSDKPRDTSKPPFNPFLNPPKELLIAEAGPSHNLVLNKFPVIPDHFILATKEFKQQTHLLEEADLGAAYDCLKAYHAEGEELFGFFNSGEHSGASQPHRHIQFLPIESMRNGLGQMKWDPLLDRLTERTSPGMSLVSGYAQSMLTERELPFTYFSATLPENVQPLELHAIYRRLHQEASQLMDASPGENKSAVTTDGTESPISYNLGITDKSMVLCPRISEGLSIKDNDNNPLGLVALNGTLLAGTLLVKSEAEWNAVRKDERILVDVLNAIGIPRTTSDHDRSSSIISHKDVKI